MLPLRRILLVSRPICYPLNLAVFGAGLITAGQHIWSWTLVLSALYWTLPASLVVYGINDIADREADAHNSRKGGLDGAALRPNEVRPLAYLIIGTVLIFPVLFALAGNVREALAVAGFSLVSYLYSAPPVRLKNVPGLDSLSNAAGTLLVFGAGYYVSRANSTGMPPLHLVGAIVLFTVGIHGLGTVADYDADLRSGERTLGTVVGRRPVLLLAAACFGACYFLVGQRNPYIGTYIVLSSLVTLLAVGLHGRHPRLVRNLGLAIVVGFPLAMLPVIL